MCLACHGRTRRGVCAGSVSPAFLFDATHSSLAHSPFLSICVCVCLSLSLSQVGKTTLLEALQRELTFFQKRGWSAAEPVKITARHVCVCVRVCLCVFVDIRLSLSLSLSLSLLVLSLSLS